MQKPAGYTTVMIYIAEEEYPNQAAFSRRQAKQKCESAASTP